MVKSPEVKTTPPTNVGEEALADETRCRSKTVRTHSEIIVVVVVECCCILKKLIVEQSDPAHARLAYVKHRLSVKSLVLLA